MFNQLNNNHFSNQESFGQGRLVKLSGSIALAAMAIFIPACASDVAETTAPGVDENVSTEEVAENTDELFGKTVTLRSEVGKKLDDISFTVDDDEFFSGEEILVVNASGQPFVLPTDDTEVQVTGEVRQFRAVEFEPDFDFDWQPGTDYENKPAIVAQSIALAPEPDEITENPEKFYNQPIAVEGEVAEIVGPNAFTLEDEELVGGSNLLVLNRTAPAQALNDDEVVVVTGQVRPFVLAEIERDYDLTWDLDLQSKLEAEYQEKPVLIADTVYPSAQ
ncbi:hypothetical protein [Lyngbya aestuarii]|uniref:hypothetical protein n=1 Tax=Lyngbya aestuarii TaxID=118322 RepID=UPI00403E03DD